MPESMGHEEPCGALRHHLVQIALHKPKLARAVEHEAGDCKMNVAVGGSRFG